MEFRSGNKSGFSAGGGMNLWMAGVFLGALALYIRTAAPVFLFDDNSEFLAAAFRLGITHAPGYPLFSLAGKLFSYLAPGSVYFGMNILSAFAGAAAVALSFRLLFSITGWWAPSLVGAAAVMVSRTFWGEAGQAEVYALNLFFTFLILNIMWGLKGDRTDAVRLAAVTFVFLLALINHYTVTLIAAVCVPYVFLLHRGDLRTVKIMTLPVFFAALTVCSIWMYLPLRSAERPLIQWQDQSEFRGFVKHLKGVDRRTDAPPATWDEKEKHIRFYGELLGSQWTPWLLLLALPGLAWLLGRHRGRGVLLLLLWLVLFGGFIFLLNYIFGPRARFVVSVFHITSMCLVAVFMGAGAAAVFGRIGRTGLPWVPVFLLAAALLGWSALVNLEYADDSANMLTPVYARNLLVNVGRDGIVFSHLETESFPVASFRAVSAKRKDIMLFGNQGDNAEDVYTVNRMGKQTGAAEQISELEMYVLTHSARQRPVYFTLRRKLSEIPGAVLMSNGLLYQVSPLLEKLARHNPWNRIDTTGIDIKYPNYDYITKNVISKYYVKRAERLLSEKRGEEAKKLFDDVLSFNPESRFLHADVAGIYTAIGQYEMARREYEMALAVDSENVELSMDTVAIYNNLSFLYGKLGYKDRAVEMMEKAVGYAPDTMLFLVNLGQTYWEMERCPDAIRELEKAVGLGHRSAAVHNILGICYEQGRQYARAEENYEKAIEIDPNMPLVYKDYGIYNAYVANRPQKAVQLLEKHIALAPDSPDKGEILVNVGFLNRQIGNYDDAVASFKSAIVFGATSSRKRLAMVMGALADSCGKTGRTQDALDAYEQGLAGAADYPDLYRDYAEFLIGAEADPEKAMMLIDSYLAAVPDAEDRNYVELLKDRIRLMKKGK